MAIAGNDISIANTASAVNQITFNPVITALTGYGTSSPAVSAPQTLTTTATATSTQPESNSLLTPNAKGATTPIGAGQYVPGTTGTATDPNAVSLGVKTNANTMIWVVVFGGMAMVLLMGGGRR